MKINRVNHKNPTTPNSRAGLVTETIKTNKSLLDSSLTQFLDNSQPMETKWYTIDQDASYKGKGFKDSSGPYDGGIKYKLINNYIAYGYLDERGVDVEEGEHLDIHFKPQNMILLHLPNTLRPKVGDRFSYAVEDHVYLYKVISSVPVTFNNKSFIKTVVAKCDIKPHSYYEEDFRNDGLITDTYEYVADNVGTDYKPFLKSDDLEAIKDLEFIKEELMTQFHDYFYDEFRNIFVAPYAQDTLSYTPLIVDLQMEFRTLWTYGINTILHHETLVNKRSKYHYRNNPLRKFLLKMRGSWKYLKDEGLIFSEYPYSKTVMSPMYKVQSYLNENRNYWIHDYYHGESVYTHDDGTTSVVAFNKHKFEIPEKYHEIMEKYFDGTLDAKWYYEWLYNFDFDITFTDMIMVFVLLTILDNVINDKQKKLSNRGGLFKE